MFLPFTLLAVLLATCVLRPLLRLLVRQHRSPLRALPGPPSASFLLGNLEEMHEQENTNLVARWTAAYGPAFVYRGFGSGCRLMITDPLAVAHVLGNAYDYPKPDFVRDSLAEMACGHGGLLTVEGDAHRRQRKILTPAFASSHIKSLAPIFWDKASELRDILLHQIDGNHCPPRVDVLDWLCRATLDVIGLAGFGYRFNALTDDTDELARAFSVIFTTAREFRVITILQAWFPILRPFRRNSEAQVQAQATMRCIGLALIEERRAEAEAEMQREETNRMRAAGGEKKAMHADVGSSTPETSETQPNRSDTGKDILSVLIRANTASHPSQRMSVEEILCQISTFLAAGHETTASALTWCLYALARQPAAQARLREALRAVADTETDSGVDAYSQDKRRAALTEGVMRCEYLDWVVRESLRLHAPVASTMRVCMRDADAIPLQGARGSVQVRKWDIISVPIQAINKAEAVWGSDAGVFRPERWASPPQGARAIPGLYSNTLTFLNGNPLGGNRACIGYKFALIEIKIFLYVLIKDIEFSIDPAMVIEKRLNIVTRPFVKSEPQLGNQMPLNISHASCAPKSAPAATGTTAVLSRAI